MNSILSAGFCLGLGYQKGTSIVATEAMGGIMAWCRRCSNDEGLGGKGGKRMVGPGIKMARLKRRRIL